MGHLKLKTTIVFFFFFSNNLLYDSSKGKVLQSGKQDHKIKKLRHKRFVHAVDPIVL